MATQTQVENLVTEFVDEIPLEIVNYLTTSGRRAKGYAPLFGRPTSVFEQVDVQKFT